MGLDYSSPGISFDLKNWRIFVYKTTAEAIGHPEYARFMFSPEDRVFGIQACGIDDEGAHRFRVIGNQYTVKIMALVRFIYETCGWENSNKMDDILREKRVVQGLTQQQVADLAKISLRQYQSFESGERNIRTSSFQLACRVIEALGMDPTKFFYGEYVIGEEVLLGGDGLRYAKTGKRINEDVE